MSYLRLYQPDVEEEQQAEPEEEPCLLSFEQFAATWKRSGRVLRHDAAHTEEDSILRARIIYANRRCPWCKHPGVEPVELDNARMNRNHRPMPGTASLVGFHCQGCCREWPA
jgi:hypothetical protein